MELSKETEQVIQKAEIIYKQNFPLTTCFERAIFFSWWCGINDCGFCYMSALPKDKVSKEESIRHEASILAEVWLCKKVGWQIGFFTGGINAFSGDKVLDMLKKINKIYGKVWLSVGPLAKTQLEKYAPYVEGIVGSLETVNEEIHKKACPSKPLAPYFRMFDAAQELKLKTAMTFIIGLGETKKDLATIREVIERYHISKIHIYGLIPHEGTMYANAQPPTADEQAWWIAQIRIAYPTLDIQCGIWSDRTERISVLLRAGANSISKFQAIKLFATKPAQDIEAQAKIGGREFLGSLTKLPEININEIDDFGFDEELTKNIKKKAEQYLKLMRRNVEHPERTQLIQIHE
ncbi:radical SAM protein [Candidatus Woesearchaeota archaeon]|nr:radical SAM protein [Candidatus Woesearchaeota archaeon]